MRLLQIHTASALGALAVACVGLACAGTPSYQKHPQPNLEATWDEYVDLPDHKAIVVAGSLRGSRWVAAVVAKQPDAARALEAAMTECGKRRTTSRVQAQCVPYAEGEKIVWRGY